ncbi:carboxylating nicotinate-nucleotide diphosphorylase [Desulfosarcina sp. OttesenSCG-928-G10]|nr:carboxylating nicotinate-nucleotide diphosphorylase [Desulfosarcina sp. OttesenSCG-928-G10]MDL2320855.1 carboxylating nicotinate-nucleotide diphosphorylase [Desulfosarcina sp. OttesenSCG-928-B08]
MKHTGLDALIQLAFAEDIGPGDITTDSMVAGDIRGRGHVVAKQELVIAGLGVAETVFRTLEPEISFTSFFTDGDRVKTGQTVLAVEGKLATLLTGERTALNFLQRLSGIATQTRSYVETVADFPVRLVDTRKTTPGWRALEKYAVRMGGGHNHRMGLYDGVLIKDNHIAVAGGITTAVEKARKAVSHLVKIEVETTTLAEVDEALSTGVDIIMLDNMNLDQIREAVIRINKKALVEVSGGVTREKLKDLAATGVDLISIGALTHSALAMDLSMRIAASCVSPSGAGP